MDLVEKVIENQSSTDNMSSDYKFMIAGYWLHRHDLDRSFQTFIEANKLKLKNIPPDFKWKANLDNYLITLQQWRPAFSQINQNNIKNIFIFAPPRSGKSTLEKILSKSPTVKPMYDMINTAGINFEKESVGGLSCSIFQNLFFDSETDLLEQGYGVITSTHPHSIFSVMGLVDKLENSFFIFVNRDEYDVASEIFMREYSEGHNYSYDTKTIMQFISFYRSCEQILESKIPERTFSVSFREIVNLPNETLRKIGGLISSDILSKTYDLKRSDIALESVFRDQFKELIG